MLIHFRRENGKRWLERGVWMQRNGRHFYRKNLRCLPGSLALPGAVPSDECGSESADGIGLCGD